MCYNYKISLKKTKRCRRDRTALTSYFKLIVKYQNQKHICHERTGLLTSLNSLSSWFSYCAWPFGSYSCIAWQVLSWSKCFQKELLLLRLCYHSAKNKEEPLGMNNARWLCLKSKLRHKRECTETGNRHQSKSWQSRVPYGDIARLIYIREKDYWKILKFCQIS